MKNFLLLAFFAWSGLSVVGQMSVQWSDSIQVFTTTNAITAPRSEFLPDGTLLVAWGTSGPPHKIWLSRFENGAFTTPVDVAPAPASPALFGFGGFDMAVWNNRIYIVFEQLQAGILLTRSDD